MPLTFNLNLFIVFRTDIFQKLSLGAPDVEKSGKLILY